MSILSHQAEAAACIRSPSKASMHGAGTPRSGTCLNGTGTSSPGAELFPAEPVVVERSVVIDRPSPAGGRSVPARSLRKGCQRAGGRRGGRTGSSPGRLQTAEARPAPTRRPGDVDGAGGHFVPISWSSAPCAQGLRPILSSALMLSACRTSCHGRARRTLERTSSPPWICRKPRGFQKHGRATSLPTQPPRRPRPAGRRLIRQAQGVHGGMLGCRAFPWRGSALKSVLLGGSAK